MAVLLHIHPYAGPIAVDLAVLLDEDVVQNIVGHAVFVRFRDGGIGQRFMIGHVQPLILEMEAVAHTAAVQPLIGKQPLQILQNGVMVLLIQILRCGLGIVVAELDGDAVGQEALDIGGQLVRRIVLIQHAVDAGGTGDPAQHLIGGFLHIFHQMAGDVHAGDLIPVAPGKVDHFVKAGARLTGEGGVDVYLVGGGNGVQHLLQRHQIRQRLTAGEHEVAAGRDGVHGADAFDNLIQAEAAHISVFFFVDAERTVVLAVIGHKDGDGGAAFAGLVRVAHLDQSTSQ